MCGDGVGAAAIDFRSRIGGAGTGAEEEGEVEVKVEATRCRDIGEIPMVATRARWRVGSCFCSDSDSGSDSGSDPELGWGLESDGV